jgi:glycosyltransferase involved in cell wall biosynthesis
MPNRKTVRRAKQQLPRVGFILLTYNDVKGAEKCIKSVKMQDYPKSLVDLVVVDNGSKDGSEKMARKLGARVFVQPKGTLYSNWIYGMHKLKCDFFFYLEQDIVLKDKNFIRKMIAPHLEDNRLMATFTKEYPKRDMSLTCQYLSYHYSQCDPLLEFLSPKREDLEQEKKGDYIVYKYELGKIPPVARMLYRVKYLKKTPNWKTDNYFDHDFITTNVKAGYPYFAYVPEAGYYHYHVTSYWHFLKKRVRNLGLHYFAYSDKTEYPWLHTDNKKEVLWMIGFVLYANTLVLPFIRGFLRMLKHRSPVLLMEPIVTIGVTDVLLWNFLKNNAGRKIISNSFRTLLSR